MWQACKIVCILLPPILHHVVAKMGLFFYNFSLPRRNGLFPSRDSTLSYAIPANRWHCKSQSSLSGPKRTTLSAAHGDSYWRCGRVSSCRVLCAHWQFLLHAKWISFFFCAFYVSVIFSSRGKNFLSCRYSENCSVPSPGYKCEARFVCKSLCVRFRIYVSHTMWSHGAYGKKLFFLYIFKINFIKQKEKLF